MSYLILQLLNLYLDWMCFLKNLKYECIVKGCPIAKPHLLGR